jgi:hypothetical protein
MASKLWIHYVYILSILKYLLNILQPYYMFIQAMLLYFSKVLQMPCIIIIISINYLMIRFVLKTIWLKINPNNILLHDDDDDIVWLIYVCGWVCV